RSATPYHGFTIMNRLNMKNLVEPINKDLEFQLQDPFLLYRNSNRPKQITVEELFGSSLSKDQNLMSFPNQSAVDKGPSDFLRGQSLGQPFSFEPAPGHRVGMEGSEDHLGTAVRAQSNTPTQTHHSSALVPRPDVKSVQNYSVPAGPVFHPPGPAEHVVLPKLGSEGGKVLVMQQAHLKPTSPLPMCQPGSEQLNPPQSSLCGPGAGGSALNMGFIHQDLLHKLQPPPQPERLPQPVLTKPALAPNFLPSHGQLATPECFKEPAAKPVAFTGIPVAPIQVAAPPVLMVDNFVGNFEQRQRTLFLISIFFPLLFLFHISVSSTE
ncbi:DCP1A enzyme, partial [Amia calva]|nr:DCP1A enzyme [Amia calva]